MDSARRVSQSKTIKGWLNPPYNRFGCLRIRRRKQYDSKKKLGAQPGKQVTFVLHPYSNSVIFSVGLGILLLGSLRLEIRRVSGHIRNDQVYWGEGDDGMGICIFDPDGIKVIDDAEQEEPPYIIFEFKFREDPKITLRRQRTIEENMDTKIDVQNHLETTRKSSKSSTSSLPAIDRANSEGMSFHVRAH